MKRVGTFLRLLVIALAKYDILLKKKREKHVGDTLAVHLETQSVANVASCKSWAEMFSLEWRRKRKQR